MLYNDEYVPVLGPAKHPAALGKPAAKVWAEIWPVIGPMIAQVQERGEATRSRDLELHLNREGLSRGDAISRSRIARSTTSRGESAAFSAPVIETTEKVIGERRLVTLRDLAAQCKGSESEQAAYDAAARVLAANARDVPFALIYRVADDGATAELDAVAGIEAGASPAAPRRVVLGGAEDLWGLGEVVSSGKAPRANGSRGPVRRARRRARGRCRRTRRWCLPVQLPGQDRPRAILVAGVSPMRALDDSYRTFFGLVATQIASGSPTRRRSRRSASVRRRSPRSTAPRRRSSRTSATSSARRSR